MKEYRKKFLELIRNRSVKYNGGSMKIKNILENRLLLESIFDILKDIKSSYAIIGDHAVAIQGYPRTTEDLDILVRSEDIKKIMKDLNLTYVGPLTIGGVTTKTNLGFELDLVAIDESWADEAIKNAQKSKYGMVVSKPYLILMKLFASRSTKDDADAIGVLKAMNDQEIEKAKELIETWLPNMVEDLDQMIEIPKLEMDYK